MKKIGYLLIVLLLFACDRDYENISDTYSNYKTSLLEKNGEEAVEYVDIKTLNYYSKVLEYAKTIKIQELQSLSIFDKMMVLSLRHKSTAKELNSFDGESLFIWAVNKGLVREESIVETTIGEVVTDGSSAKVQIVDMDNNVWFYYRFVKSDGDWKIDLTSMFPNAKSRLRNLARQQKMTDIECVFFLLEQQTGEKVNRSIMYKMVD